MLEQIIMQRRHSSRRTIYHLQDRHNLFDEEPSEVRKHIGETLLELHNQGIVQAVFCENIIESTEPIMIEPLIEMVPARYFRFLTGTSILLYGTEKPELHKKHLAIMRARAQIIADIINEIRAAHPNASTSELLTYAKESQIPPEFGVLSIEFEKLIKERSDYIIDYAVKVSMQKGYQNIAVVCGKLHTQSLKLQARSHKYGFVVIKHPPAGFRDHDERLQALYEYTKIK